MIEAFSVIGRAELRASKPKTVATDSGKQKMLKVVVSLLLSF